MTKKVEQKLKEILIRNLVAFADDADDFGMSEEEQEEMYGLAERLENGTATEEDWLEALAQVDLVG